MVCDTLTWFRSCDLTFCLTSIITGSHDKVIVIVYTIVVRIIVCSTFELWSVTFSLLTCVSFQEDDWYASAWWRPSRNESRKESWVRSPESGLTQERHLSSIILKPCLMYVGEYFYYALFWWDSQLSGANSLPQGILLMALTLLANLMSETDFWEINPCKFPEYQESVFFFQNWVGIKTDFRKTYPKKTPLLGTQFPDSENDWLRRHCPRLHVVKTW